MFATEFRCVLLHFFQAIRAHAVSGLDVETPDKILFKTHPFAIVTDFPAPGADPQQTFEVMHTGKQAAGQSIDDPPNKKNEDALQSAVTPINDVDLIAEEPMRPVTEFI